jgi:hypothetical protein
MSFDPDIVSCIVREVKSAFWAAGLVVSPVAIVIVQKLFAGSMAPPTCKLKVAEGVPDPDKLGTAKVVLPQPPVVGVARLAIKNSGSLTSMTSFISKSTFTSKPTLIVDSVEASGFAMDSSERIMAVGLTADDDIIAVTGIFFAFARDTAAVLAEESAF